jgi:hypothetical protein
LIDIGQLLCIGDIVECRSVLGGQVAYDSKVLHPQDVHQINAFGDGGGLQWLLYLRDGQLVVIDQNRNLTKPIDR